jgi:putative ABC transport system ATP-binding protein
VTGTGSGSDAIAEDPSTPSIHISALRFAYGDGKEILNIPEMAVARGEKIFLHGPSGSGKTTLLGLLAGVLRAKDGLVSLLGQDLARLPGSQRDRFRGAHIGYIFQMFNLIPYLDVFQNIALPCRINPERRARLGNESLPGAVSRLAERLGISDFLQTPILELSVGQQQRVAAARALLGRPEIIIADEPTSALDTDHRRNFLNLLFDSCQESGATLVFVSHDRGLSQLFDRSLSLPELNKAQR